MVTRMKLEIIFCQLSIFLERSQDTLSLNSHLITDKSLEHCVINPMSLLLFPIYWHTV